MTSFAQMVSVDTHEMISNGVFENVGDSNGLLKGLMDVPFKS